jgi:hypothetical protein
VTPAQGSTRLPTLATVSGTGFHVGALLYAGRVPAAVTVVSPEAMEATMPAQPTGTVDVVVVNPDGSFGVLAAGFTYPAVRPVVSSVQPGRGPLAGGLSVAVLGEGFEPGARVLFGRAEVAGVAGTDGMVLRATVPAGPAGLVDVTVVNPDGRSGSLVDAFAYDPTWAPGPRPEVTVVQPGRGPSTGGSAVLVKGAGLVPGCAVLFADRPATGVVVLDQATVFAVTPAVAPGPAHVSVVNPDGQVGVLAGGFTYVAPETLGTPPTLTGVSPATGKESMPTTALLTGRGLRSGAFVFFGGFPAGNPLLLSSTIMQAEARPHVPGTVDVALTNPDGQSAFLRGAFTYVPLPSLASLTPHRGPTAGGTEVLVAGDGFQPGLKLLVGGLEATGVVVQGPTLLSCVTPPGHPGLADAEVRNPDGQNSVMAGAFTYDPPPSITRITPSSGPATGGTVAVLAGGSFMEGVTVKVGSVTASSRLVATDQVVVRLPPGVVGFADVTVENPDGQRATAQRLFQYRDPATMGPAPTLTELVPARGPLSGGTLALMAGAGFGEGMVAFLDMAPVSALFVAAADVATAVTPLGRVPGAVDLAVTNPDGQSAHLAGAFTYVAPASLGPAPALATVTPQEASIFGGSLVAAGGANFAAGALFFFGGRPSVSVTVEGGSAATVVAPAGLPGPAAVAMTNPDGQTATYLGAFSYVVPAPQILVVNPNTGTGRGGTAITISGRNFQEGAVVRLGAAFCQSTVVVDPTRLACVTPPGVDGPAVVSVTNQDGQSAELAAGYTYVAPPDPQRVSPTSGPQAGGTAISITGAFFRPGVSVHVGGVACLNVARVSAALLNCDTPPGAVPGPAAVVVTNTDGQDGTVAAGFTYLPPIPPPSVTKVTPNHGSRRGGDGVTVVGESFQVGAVVSFGGTAAPVANVMSSTAISVITPAHAEGTVEVVVVNPDGQSARKEAAFQYLADGTLPPLVVTAITPNTGSVTGNTQITLTGNGFQAGLAVTVGAALCGSVTRLGPTAVTCKTPPVGAPGTVNVTVTNPDGQQVVVVGGYTYDTKRRFVLEGHNLPAEASRFKVAAGLADLDGDGDLDVFEVMANISGSNPSGTALPRLRINDGLGRFVERTAGLPAEPSGNTSRSWVSMVDVDGDGDIDPVFFKEGEMVIYVNDGTATFTRRSAPVCRDSGNNIRNMSITSFAPLDLEGDGDVDFVVGRWSDRTDCWVSGAWVAVTGEVVMVNDGVGNFAFSYTRIPPVQDATTSVKAADLDRDGDMDILVTNENNHQNRLYYNDGAGYFTDVSLSLLGVSAGNARDAVIGDIEGDGDLDIFIAFNGQRNRLYVNLGTGAFTDVTLTGRMPEVTENSYRMWLLDHDGDGDLDLWVRRVPTTGFLQPFRVHQNDGTGWFLADSANALLPASLREEVASAGPGDMAAYAFGDLDRDGYVDMFWGQSGWQDRILLNDTQGGFDFRTISSVTEMRANAEDAASGDLDGDGDVDVVMCQSSEMGVRVFLNDAAGNLVDVTEARFPAVRFSCSDIDLADVDRDGDLDILVAATTTPIPSPSPSGATGASVYLFINNGLGVFRDETNPRLPTDSLNRGLAPLAMEPLDYDNDGDMDLMVGRNGCASSGNGLRLWENAALGSGHYVDVTDTALARVSVQLGCYYGTSCGNVVDIQVGDVDNNGTVDVFAARLGRGCYMADSLFNNVILFNTGDRKFEDVTTSKMASPVQGRKARLFHANGDGTLDLYLVYDTDDRLYLNTGGGIFSDVTPSNLPRVDNSRGAVDVDVDGDGDMDLVVVKTGAARPRLLLNTGLGIFGDYSDGKIPVLEDVSVNVLSADFTGDGMGDLFVVNQGQCRVLVNKP